MGMLQPLSEDFLYWNPEEIYQSPQDRGPEDVWFIQSSHLYQVVNENSEEASNGQQL